MTHHDLIIDTLRIALSAHTHPSLEEAALHVGAELAAVSELPVAMCAAVVFSALSSDIPDHAVAERVARSLRAPVRV